MRSPTFDMASAESPPTLFLVRPSGLLSSLVVYPRLPGANRVRAVDDLKIQPESASFQRCDPVCVS